MVVALVLLCGLVYFGSSKIYYKYKYFKAVEKQLTITQNEIKTYQEKEQKLIEEGKTTVVKAKKRSKNIDTKLKNDEKAIDNSTINDIQLRDFLAKHGENTD